MVTIKDIAKIVASQHNIKVAEAEEFVQKLVDTINEGLEVDRSANERWLASTAR